MCYKTDPTIFVFDAFFETSVEISDGLFVISKITVPVRFASKRYQYLRLEKCEIKS